MPPAPVKIGKFKASRIVVKESWAVLKQDKEIMLFPIISSIFTTIIFLILAAVFYFLIIGGNLESLDSATGNVIFYVGLLIYYLIIFFIINFFQAGLFIIVQARFTGGNLSFKDGINGAKKFAGKIFIWSLINATVGVVLRVIADKAKIVGQIISAVLGAAWQILTYFSLPSLIIGNTTIKGSFKESAAIIRKTWGETLIVNFGVGLFFGLMIMAVFVIGLIIVILIPSIYVAIPIGVIIVAGIIILSIISTTLGSIFKLALYNYAKNGVVPQAFSPEIVKGAIK